MPEPPVTTLRQNGYFGCRETSYLRVAKAGKISVAFIGSFATLFRTNKRKRTCKRQPPVSDELLKMAAARYIRAIFLGVLLIVGSATADPLNPQGDNVNTVWLIAPHNGIGRLTFGISPEAVASMAPLYGKPSPLLSKATVASDVEEVIALYGATMSAETIDAIRRHARELANFATQNLTMGQTPILLEYRDAHLAGVTVESRHKEVNFEGKLVFSLSALEVLELFERANGAPGRYRSDEAAFDNIAVSLYRFSSTSSNGEVRAIPEADPDFPERSVTLRREPYRPADELDQFVTFSFNQTGSRN